MTAPLAISGTFSDLKIVKTRSVVQVIIEVPIEQAKSITDAFGFPVPGKEIHIALARMNTRPESKGKGLHAPTPFRSLPRSQQAALACRDVAFQKWLGVRVPDGSEIANHAAATRLRDHLGLVSRASLDLSGNTTAHKMWDALYVRFEEETGRVPA